MTSSPSSLTGHGQSIDVESISMVYPGADHPSLFDVSLEIEPGEFMTFLGPSGSGKTTLLSVIAGFVSPSRGHVRIGGENIEGLKPHKRDLGVVFQNYLLFPHMTVAENIAYPLKQRKASRSRIDERVEQVLDMVQLREYADRLPSQLSGGQQQRVAFARAVVYEPRALLMDEPLGALDKNLRGEMQRELTRMHRQLGMTFVFVTHDQEEAMALSDRIAVFNSGRIEQIGTPEELYRRPRTLFVARFLGDSNIFPGQVDAAASTFEYGGVGIGLTAAQLASAPAGPLALMVRPEDLRLSADDEAGEGLRATVQEMVFSGGHTTVHLRYADGENGIARVSDDEVGSWRVGQMVRVGWDREKHHLLSCDG